MFTDTGPLETNDEAITEKLGYLVENASLVKNTNANSNLRHRGSYRRYNLNQIEKLFDLAVE
jgi:hypothetical protein